MTKRLPPLNSIRAFEAAARLLSFKAAADELNVTHSAISHQIKQLETDLGLRLFHRHVRQIELTIAGRDYYPQVNQAFEGLREASDRLRHQPSSGSFTVQVYVTVAMRWLIRRLPDFQKNHPDIQVQLSTSYAEWGFQTGQVDAALLVRYNRETGLHYRDLAMGKLYPVLSPELLDKGRGLNRPEDLMNYPLLGIFTSPSDWSRWFAATGFNLDPQTVGISYDSYVLSYEAAVAGEGVAMGETAFIDDDLAQGRLLRPFEETIPRGGPWAYVCERGRENESKIKAFGDWLAEQFEADENLA